MANTPAKTTVLIVDDSPINLRLLFDYLHRSGFRVLVAESGESALERTVHANPDIILLDVLMPGIDGFETCRRLKENPATRDIPVIFMTALADTIDKVKGFESGAVDYLTKPLQHEELLARLNTHLTLRELQRELQTQITEHQKLIADLDAFAHTVAHDLKGPVGVIVSYLTYLKEIWSELSPEELDHYLSLITNTGQKMKTIIDELLLLAGVRQGEAKLGPLDMTTMIADVKNRLTYLTTEYQFTIMEPETWPIAIGYAPWIEEVWVNYISNAIKYGGTSPTIQLGATYQPNAMLRFWITDTGAGLTPEEQDRLFMPFTRLDQAQTRGYGLGLSIVKRIVEKLNGQVGVESEKGHGSTFYFTLPAYQPEKITV